MYMRDGHDTELGRIELALVSSRGGRSPGFRLAVLAAGRVPQVHIPFEILVARPRDDGRQMTSAGRLEGLAQHGYVHWYGRALVYN
jgi:hypothetical protein